MAYSMGVCHPISDSIRKSIRRVQLIRTVQFRVMRHKFAGNVTSSSYRRQPAVPWSTIEKLFLALPGRISIFLNVRDRIAGSARLVHR